MTRKGVKSDKFSVWIDHNIEIDDKLRAIMEDYVIGTPSYGLSKKGRDLYSYYGYKTVGDYEHLFYDMIDGIKQENLTFASTYEELGQKIINHAWLCFTDFPTDVEEAIIIYAGEDRSDKLYKQFFLGLPPIESKGKTNDVRSSEKEQRMKIVYVNKVFYHIRNSLAHGGIGVFEGHEDTYYLFQDEDNSGNLSARLVLKHKRLHEWIQLLEGRRNRNQVEQICSVDQAV